LKLSLTAQCMLGLLLGVLVGIALPQLPVDSGPALGAAEAVVRLWTNAFRLVVTPLVMVQLFTAISLHRGSKGEAGRLGMLIPAVFATLLVLTALLSLAVTAGMLSIPGLAGQRLEGVAGNLPTIFPGAAASGGSSWLDELVPPNLFAAAGTDSLLALMLFSLAFALAARRLAPERQRVLESAALAVRDTLFALVDWLVRVAPVVLLAFAVYAAATSGLAIGEVLLDYTIIALVVYGLCTLALYPVASLAGGVSPLRFARALIPAQAIAVATRSSLATVPALLRGADDTLRLPPKISALVVPLGGALLKLSRAASAGAKLLFLAQLLGLQLSAGQVVVFTVTIILLSPSTQGVPRVISGQRSMPAYVAIGIPPEYVVLLGAANAVTDVLQTVLNSTGYLTSAVLVSRYAGQLEPAPEPVARADAAAPPPPLPDDPVLRA